jgi:hypothetical protein
VYNFTTLIGHVHTKYSNKFVKLTFVVIWIRPHPYFVVSTAEGNATRMKIQNVVKVDDVSETGRG